MQAPSMLSSVLVLSLLVWSPLPASAEIILPGVNYYGTIQTISYDGNQRYDVFNQYPLPSASQGWGSYSSALSPRPMVTFSTSANSPNTIANVYFDLGYFFEVTGPGPVVSIHAISNWTLRGGGFASLLVEKGATLATGLSRDMYFDVFVDRVYAVDLIIQSDWYYYGQSPPSAAAADLFFTIDPQFPNASQYQLFFSPGVGNSSVPAPTTFVMLSSLGLTVLGIGGIRKRLKRTTAAA